MPPKDILQKRTRKLVGLHHDTHVSPFVSSEVRREPNPISIQARKRRQPTQYTTHPLPLRNPYQAAPGQLCFTLPPKLTNKTGAKKLVTQLPTLEIATICDKDENFYKVVEGRSFKSDQDIKNHMNNIRDIAMGHASAAYIVDRILCLDENNTLESALYDECANLFREIKLNFMKFLREKNTEATLAQKRAKTIADHVTEKNDELEMVAHRFVELRTVLSAIRVEFSSLARYRVYLNRMSPLSWREKHDEVYQRQMTWKGRVLSVFFPRFEKIRDGEDFYDIGENIIIELDPKLYFRKSRELMELFEFLENQSLNYLQNSIQMAEILKKVLLHRDNFILRFEIEVKNINDLMDFYEARVTETEEREINLKRSFQELLHGFMKRLVSSRESKQLDLSVEWVHRQLFGESLGQGERNQMMRRIQALYFELGTELDLLDGAAVRVAEREYFALEARRAVEAQRARAQLVQWANMKRALHTAFEPPYNKSSNKLPNIVGVLRSDY